MGDVKSDENGTRRWTQASMTRRGGDGCFFLYCGYEEGRADGS